jgi:hypothetical protein
MVCYSVLVDLSRRFSTVRSTVGTTSTMAIQPTFITQTKTKTSSILNGISFYKEMIYTSSKGFTITLESTCRSTIGNSSF